MLSEAATGRPRPGRSPLRCRVRSSSFYHSSRSPNHHTNLLSSSEADAIALSPRNPLPPPSYRPNNNPLNSILMLSLEHVTQLEDGDSSRPPQERRVVASSSSASPQRPSTAPYQSTPCASNTGLAQMDTPGGAAIEISGSVEGLVVEEKGKGEGNESVQEEGPSVLGVEQQEEERRVSIWF